MARLLYLDCFSGASGDMILGALIDASVPFPEVAKVVDSLGLDGVSVAHRRVNRSGIGATKFRVIDGQHADTHDHLHTSDHGHTHDHHHSPDNALAHSHQLPNEANHHRGLSEITEVVERSALSPTGRARAVALFRRLAEVEADIHQMPVEDVHLHEVGAVDSIVDIVGAVFALEWIGADRIVASPLNVGSGTVVCAHGELPVPAPATTRLLGNAPIYAAGPSVELLTPTGALLITAYADAYGPMPSMRIAQTGYGAGDRDLEGRPNVVRAFVGDTADSTEELERVVVLECEIDDMNPQIYGLLMDRLVEAGALDVFYTPIQMKKNRPGTLVTIIVSPEHREALMSVLFAESTTIGVRVTETSRECLDREMVVVESPLGAVRVKVARRNGVVVNAAPEFDDCARVATELDRSVKEVQAVAMKAWLELVS